MGGGGGGWVHCDYNVSSAPFVSELRLRELNLDRKEQELSLTKAD